MRRISSIPGFPVQIWGNYPLWVRRQQIASFKANPQKCQTWGMRSHCKLKLRNRKVIWSKSKIIPCLKLDSLKSRLKNEIELLQLFAVNIAGSTKKWRFKNPKILYLSSLDLIVGTNYNILKTRSMIF